MQEWLDEWQTLPSTKLALTHCLTHFLGQMPLLMLFVHLCYVQSVSCFFFWFSPFTFWAQDSQTWVPWQAGCIRLAILLSAAAEGLRALWQQHVDVGGSMMTSAILAGVMLIRDCSEVPRLNESSHKRTKEDERSDVMWMWMLYLEQQITWNKHRFMVVLVRVRGSLFAKSLSGNLWESQCFSCIFMCMRFDAFSIIWETFMPLPSHGLNAELKYLLVSSYFFMCFFLRHILISNFTCRVLVSLLMLMFSPWWKFFGLESFWAEKLTALSISMHRRCEKDRRAWASPDFSGNLKTWCCFWKLMVFFRFVGSMKCW